MQDDNEVCLCFHVTRRKVLAYIRNHRPIKASQLAECQGAGTGCGWCRQMLTTMLRNFTRAESLNSDSDSLESNAADSTISWDAYAEGRQAYIRAGKGTPPPSAP